MKHLFICFTPLQLITAINIKVSMLQDDDVTLYILDYSHMHKEMYKKAKSSKLFTKVILLETLAFVSHWSQRYRITRYTTKAMQYWKYESYSSKIIDDATVYDKFWISFVVHSSWLLFLANKKKNNKLELLFFEDGVGSYRLLTARLNRWELKLLHFLGHKSLFEEMKALYLYEPSLAINTLYSSIEIKALPKIIHPNVKNLLNDIFTFRENDLELLNCQYVFFDAPYQADDVQKQQFGLIDYFIRRLGNAFCVKLHPRTLLDENEYGGHVSNIKTPIEMLCLNADVSQNVLISVLSTASITPKLMFGQEPIIIFLYKLVNFDTIKHIDDMYFRFIENFVATYIRPDRVFIPKSLDELEEILKVLSSDSKQNHPLPSKSSFEL